MKLKNKKTGEIGNFVSTNYSDPAITIMDDNGIQLAKYTSLAELNAEWEDYEEPKSYWSIDCLSPDGLVSEFTGASRDVFMKRKSIGNYFETKEEAEKAVEKLKAAKRLKDKGFKFLNSNYRYDQPIVKDHSYYNFIAICKNGDVYEDIDLLFGGENE